MSMLVTGEGSKMSEHTDLPGITRPEEEQKLADVIMVAAENLKKANLSVAALKGDLNEMLELYGEKDIEALTFWNNATASLNEAQEELLRCEKARKKPYFGRIDFTDDKTKKAEAYYIGRVGIRKSVTEREVIDWRAPVATVYYENSLGKCSYTVQGTGKFEIKLTRKRTYEIAEDKLVDYYDSEVVANDDLLTKYLAKSKKAVLGEIIATIQKEQNLIIRKSPRNNILVQGVAGSGKTTVAMHRISYILYNYEGEFRPKDFYIVGSNRILLNYITSVLPDLDVYGIAQMTMEQLFTRLLYEDWDADKYQIRSVKKGDTSACMKGSYQWFHELEDFCARYEWEQVPHETVRIEKTNRILVQQEETETYIKECTEVSMQNKILLLNERVMSRLENELCCRDISYTPEDKHAMRRFYRFYFGKKLWKGSIFELYEQFLKEQNEKESNIEIPEHEFDVYDLAALAYLYKRIKETDTIREASHVVIDEAQDFGMMAYASLKYCLRGCTYTIMGDVSQNIHFGYGLNDWEELKGLVLKDKFDTFGLLKKSYRNTVEISNFATSILRHGTFAVYPVEPIIRHGNEVRVTHCENKQKLVKETVKTIQDWQAQEHETIAIVCRDEREADEVTEALQGEVELTDSNLETAEFGSGVMVLPVEYTKGLEFDAVLLFNPSNETYPADDGHVKLLYVAATRALHELVVLHRGDLTDLIAKKVSSNKKMDSFEMEQAQKTKEMQKRNIPREPMKPLGRVKKKELKETDPLSGAERRTGPKRVMVPGKQKVVMKREVPAESTDNICNSPYQFGDVPDADKLRAAGHGRIDTSMRWLKKNTESVFLASSYGILRIQPVDERIIRITFQKGQAGTFDDTEQWLNTQNKAKWMCKETRDAVGIATAQLLVKIEKKTGTMQFYTRGGKLLLSERVKDARQVDEEQNKVWAYFDWARKEKLWAKGLATEDLLPMDMKARYISYGKKKMRMPYVVSDNGYGLAVASKHTVMCCNIPMYGTYISAEDTQQIDYYFMYGGSAGASVELYKMVIRK